MGKPMQVVVKGSSHVTKAELEMSHLFINDIGDVSSRQKWKSNEAQESRQKF